MINIITGKIDSGKTTKMIKIYMELRSGNGFITKKIYYNEKNIGQRVVELSTGKHKVFSLKTEFIPNDWNERFRYYDYSFSVEGISFAEKIIQEAINVKEGPIFIDEIGPLEINNEQGLFNVFSEIIRNKRELYVVVRDYCLEPFINKFNISKYKLI